MSDVSEHWVVISDGKEHRLASEPIARQVCDLLVADGRPASMERRPGPWIPYRLGPVLLAIGRLSRRWLCAPTLSQIAWELGVSSSTARTRCMELRELGFLEPDTQHTRLSTLGREACDFLATPSRRQKVSTC